MILLTFAHPGEAQAFIKNGAGEECRFATMKAYRLEREWILITGEGIKNSTEKIPTFAKAFQDKITKIMNFGVSCALDTNLSAGGIYPIRNCYQEGLADPIPTSDPNASIDCITSHHRITDIDYGKKLLESAPIADMECWAQASIARNLNLPFYSYKIISDHLGDKDAVKKVKDIALQFSEDLYYYYKSLPID